MCTELTLSEVEKENKGLFGKCNIFKAGHKDEATFLQMGILQFSEFSTVFQSEPGLQLFLSHNPLL